MDFRERDTTKLPQLHLTPAQEAVLDASARSSHLIVSSGNRAGASTVAAVLAYRAVLDGWDVTLVTPTQHQMTGILWREIRRRWPSAARFPSNPFRAPVTEFVTGGSLSVLTSRSVLAACSDLQRPDRTFWVVDNAEAVGERAYDAIRRSVASGAKMAAFGKPIGGGWFEQQVRALLDSPNGWKVSRGSFVRMCAMEASTHRISGLASREWIEEVRRHFLADFNPRVRGLPKAATER